MNEQPEKLMVLRVETSAGDIHIENVQEYVCGKHFFYINVADTIPNIKVIKRNIIETIYRSDGNSEWQVNLKTFKSKF